MEAMKIELTGDVVSVSQAAELMGVDERTVRRYVDSGKLRADATLSVFGGGSGGKVYRVYVDSLPIEAQILYLQESGLAVNSHCGDGKVLADYKERHGEAGMKKLLHKIRATQAAHGLRLWHEEHGVLGYKAKLKPLGNQFGVPGMTLYNWERAYSENGLAGLIRKDRKDAGQSRGMCLLARDYTEFLMCDSSKPTQEHVLEKVKKRAQEAGVTACEECIYRHGSEAREEWLAEYGGELPMCKQDGEGMVATESRYVVNRAVDNISDSVLAYAREGSRAWDANWLQKTKRNKPTKSNDCWFGDHHMIDVFVLDRDGGLVRPWLTAWQDACTSAIVGWMLKLNPNSETIAISYKQAVMYTEGSPFHGLSRVAYMDNGMDYKSHKFVGGEFKENNLGRLNQDIFKMGMLEALGVKTKNAIPYWAWTKPIERTFGTLESRYTRDFPGWCGNSPDARPQDFGRELKKLVEAGKLMTFETFAECYVRDVINAYNNLKGADGLSPIERYERVERARTDDPDERCWRATPASRS